MKKSIRSVFLVFVFLTVLVSGCASAPTSAPTTSAADESGTVYVAKLVGIDGLSLIGIHVSDADSSGKQTIRAYVCDGLPTDEGGFALWFKGDVAPGELSLTAPNSTDRLTLTLGDTVDGSVTFADGRIATFQAPVVTDGSGIYNVTVGADGSYTGRSTMGDVLTATITNDSAVFDGSRDIVEGTFTPKGKSPVAFRSISLRDESLAVDSFVAVVMLNPNGGTPVVLDMAGRSGDVRGGFPGGNIIGLDQEV
jgi:hypothetical protein